MDGKTAAEEVSASHTQRARLTPSMRGIVTLEAHHPAGSRWRDGFGRDPNPADHEGLLDESE
jgi:hypothetical protein